MVSVFLSTAVHVNHQPKGTQVIIDNSLEEKLYKPILKYHIVTTRQVKYVRYCHFPVELPNQNKTYFLKIIDHYLLWKGPKFKFKSRLLLKYLRDINVTYFLISSKGTTTLMSVLDDTVSELPYFKTTLIYGYKNQLLTHSPNQLKPYAMLEYLWDVHDAVQELKDLQMDNGDGDTLLGISRAVGNTLESVT